MIASLAGFILLSSFLEENEIRKYAQQSTIPLDHNNEQTLVIAFRDTLINDSLFLVKTKDDIPIHYYKNIKTEVCFDNECRLLIITVYWNITSRYLGFELPDGEFLSKYEHEPFVAIEYERLNELLANPNLPLGNISLEELIKIPITDVDSVDGISGATTEDVSKMVVKGAAYTTYTLWNIVHGATRDLVANLTEKQLSPDLINLILNSPDITDRVWVLNRIDQKTDLNPELTTSLLDIISSEDFFLAYSAINAIKSSHLNSDRLQIDLFLNYQQADHSIKKMIIEKLMEAPRLSTEVVESSRKLLSTLNGQQLKSFLYLYSKFEINDLETCKAVAEILKNRNQFVSKQAYKFLIGSNTKNKEITELLDNYRLGE